MPSGGCSNGYALDRAAHGPAARGNWVRHAAARAGRVGDAARKDAVAAGKPGSSWGVRPRPDRFTWAVSEKRLWR